MQLITPELFWQIAGSYRDQPYNERVSSLIERLSKYSIEEISGFQVIFQKLINKAALNELLLAGELIYRGLCSDDTFLYLRAWLVFQGEEIYNRVLDDVDSLAAMEVNFDKTEAYLYIPFKAYVKKTKLKNFYSVCDSDVTKYNTKSGIGRPLWVKSDETIDFEKVEQSFPLLYKKYGSALKDWLKS